MNETTTVEKEMILEEWTTCPWPWMKGKLVGRVYNDTRKRFEDGSVVFTSPVVDAEDGYVLTMSGLKYKLGTPHRGLFNLLGGADYGF